MLAATNIAVLFIVIIGFTNGQDEGLLGLPVDFDDFGLDFRNVNLYKDQDIFKEEENLNVSPEQTIRRLCNEYDLIINNQRIDCSNVKLAEKALKTDEHSVHKREAGDETQLDEGSGAGEEQDSAPEATAEGEPPAAVEEGQPLQETPAEAKEEEPPTEAAVDVPDADAVEQPGGESEQPKESPSEVTEEQPDVKENDVPLATADESVAQTTIEAEAATTESTLVKESDVTEGVVKKKGRKLTPTKLTEGENAKESENSETVKENQSGIAVFHSDSKGTLEATDNAVNNMQPNEKLKQATTGTQSETGESTKEIQQGRKDTKVLIILFVAVVVVGGAAFAYNFIKKRKQKKAETTENGANNATPKDVTNSVKSDPEQGTELKPLMKNAEQKPVVAEYTDEKETTKAEEVK